MADDLFILVVPMYSKQELNADSTYVMFTKLAEAVHKLRPGWFFFLPFPDSGSGYKYEDDGFFQRNRYVVRVPQRISPRKQSNAVSYDGFFYDRLFRNVAFDAVWCNLVESAGHVKYAGHSTYESRSRPFIVATHNYVIHETLPYPVESMLDTLLQQLHGAMLADANVFISEYCRWMLMDNAKRYLSESSCERIEESGTLIYNGTLEHDSEFEPRKHEGPPIIAYNHRLQGYKNYAVTFELLNRLYKAGVKFRLKYMNNTSEHLSKITHYPFVDVRLCATRSDYLRELGECDINITNSQYETFCISAIESMAFGQPLLAPKAITFPEIVGLEETRYPYLFESPVQQEEMLRRLLSDAGERKKWGRVLSKFVRDEFNNLRWAEQYIKLFEEGSKKLAGDYRLTSPKTLDRVISKLRRKQVQKIAVGDFLNLVYREKDEGGKQNYSNQSFPAVKAIRILRDKGFRITFTKQQEIVL